MNREELLETATFNVLIKGPRKSYADVRNISYKTARSLCEDIMRTCKDEFLENQLAQAMTSFGFRGFGGNGYDITIDAYMPQQILTEKHCCGSKTQQTGSNENDDVWIQRGKDVVCGYCGSASWETFTKAIDEALKEGSEWRIEATDKRYKYYIHNPDVPNASFGAIKFYTWHVPHTLTADDLDMWNKKTSEAVKISHAKFLEKFNIPHS